MRDVRQEDAVLLPRGVPVHAVQPRVVEKVPPLAPRLVEDLAPFLARVDRRDHPLELERQRLGVRRGVGVGDEVGVLLAAEDQPVAVEGEVELGDVVEDDLVLARREVEAVQRAAPLQVPALEVEERLADARAQRAVVPLGERQGDDAAADAVEVDPRLAGARRRGGLLRRGPLVARLGLRRGGALVGERADGGGRLLVALQADRRRLVGGEDRELQRAPHRPLERRHLQPAGVEAVVRAGGEVEVLAVGAEAGGDGVPRAVGHLPLRAGHDVVDEDGAEVVLEPLRVGEVAAVGRPVRIEAPLRRFVGVRVHDRAALLGEVDDPDVEPLVGQRDPASVGGPARLVEEVPRTEVHDERRLEPRLVAHVEAVLARGVGEIGDPLPVGGPGRIALVRAGGARDVARRAALRRHGEDLAARGEEGARAGRGDPERLDRLRRRG